MNPSWLLSCAEPGADRVKCGFVAPPCWGRVACCCFLSNNVSDAISLAPAIFIFTPNSRVNCVACGFAHVVSECFTREPCGLPVTAIESSGHSSVWQTGGPAGLQCALWASALLGAKLSHPLTRGSNFSVPLSLPKKATSHVLLSSSFFCHCAIQISLSPPTLAGSKRGDADSREYSLFKFFLKDL